jgi:DNA-binding transcriptional ArsR family regulator
MAEPEPTVADATRSLLLAVRLRPMAPVSGLASVLAAMGLAGGDVEVLLSRLELAGLVEFREREGGPRRWRLTEDGRREGERLLAEEVDRLGVRSGVTGAYDRFVARNGALLRVCTDWQLRDANPSAPVANDHTDPAYDRAVIDQLGALHTTVLPICAALTGELGRFGVYGPRFEGAMARIGAGDLDAIDSPSADSYHAVWFELHDHLLATLGRDRSLEPLPEPAWKPPSP